MSILALETSTTHGSVVVLNADGATLFEDGFVADRTHSSYLFAAVERARAETGHWEQIAVGLGPGSYAGVRIAISAGLGLSMIGGAELLGVPSVAAFEVEGDAYCAVGDARRDSFYWSVVRNGVCEQGPELIPGAELPQRLAAQALPVYSSEPLAQAPTIIAHPSARRLAQIALAGRGVTQRGNLEPIYLREPHITWPKQR